MRKKSVLDVLRRDPNTMDVDRHRETRRYYNCGEAGYLATRCSKPKKERREEVRIVKGEKKNFSWAGSKFQLTCHNRLKSLITQ